MERSDADLLRKSARVIDTGEERVLDLRGNGVAKIVNLDTTGTEATRTGLPSDCVIHKPAADTEETDKMETDMKQENVADENKGESTSIQQGRTARQLVDAHDTIKKLVEEIARIENASSTGQIPVEFAFQKAENMTMEGLNHESRTEKTETLEEILGTGLDSVSIDLPGHIDEYIYKNFQRTALKFIFSWRKRPFNKIYILPPPRVQLPGECALHATLALMECHFKVLFASHPHGPREFNVRLSHLHLGNMVREFCDTEEGRRLKGKGRGKLKICLLMAQINGVVSEEDYAGGSPPEAVRYRIDEFSELSDIEMEMIPSLLEGAEMILTSFRVTEAYRQILPHDIYRYRAPEKAPDVHDAHCVVLTSSGVEFKDPEIATDGEVPEWEVYYEYLNSYDGWGVDGCGYIYHDSLRRSYRITVVDPEI